MELILGRVQPVLAFPRQCHRLAARSQPWAGQRRHTASLLCVSAQRPLKPTEAIQICLFLGSPSSWKKDVLQGGVWGQHHLRIWFCRQSSPGLDLWFPHAGLSAGSCCNTDNILGHYLWLFVPFCTFSNEDCAHYLTELITSQLGLHFPVLSHIFVCRSVIALLPYFIWSFIHKRALSFIHHQPNHLFLPLKTGLL